MVTIEGQDANGHGNWQLRVFRIYMIPLECKSSRASTIVGQCAGTPGQLFDSSGCHDMWGIRTWEAEVKTQVELGFE